MCAQRFAAERPATKYYSKLAAHRRRSFYFISKGLEMLKSMTGGRGQHLENHHNYEGITANRGTRSQWYPQQKWATVYKQRASENKWRPHQARKEHSSRHPEEHCGPDSLQHLRSGQRLLCNQLVRIWWKRRHGWATSPHNRSIC